MHEPLKNKIYIRKKLFFIFLGADFLMPKSGHQLEKQPVLGPTHGFSTSFLGANRNSICSRKYVIWHFISTPTVLFQECHETFMKIFASFSFHDMQIDSISNATRKCAK